MAQQTKYKLTRSVKEPEKKVNLTKLFVDFSMKYRNVFMVKICDETYIYRSLGRGEFREIMEDRRFTNLQKEEIICSQCLLYPDPETYDWKDKPAGIPTELMKAVLTDSVLDNEVRQSRLHDYYRSEMYQTQNQITCLICKAFPNLDIEEVEKWDMDKTYKYLSRAEWILQNIDGIRLESDAQPQQQMEEMQREYGRNNEDELGNQYAPEPQPQPESPEERKTAAERKLAEFRKRHGLDENGHKVAEDSAHDSGTTIRGGSRANKLTPEKIREREEFFRRHPDFAAQALQGSVDDIAHMKDQPMIDIVSPALRVPGQNGKIDSGGHQIIE